MTTRRKEVSDETVLRAVQKVLRRDGARLTLAAVAAEAGLSAPRLVQRFGSRTGLLLAALSRWEDRAALGLRTHAESPRPLASYLAELATAARGIKARELAASIHWMAVEWTSPPLVRAHRRFLERFKRALTEVLRAAQAAGELERHDSAALAEQMIVLSCGLAVYYPVIAPRADYRTILRRALATELAPYRRNSRSLTGRKASRALGLAARRRPQYR